MEISPIQRFWNILTPYRPELRQIYSYAVFIGIVNLSLPLGIQAIINYIQTGEMTSSWIVLVGFVLTGIAITGMLQVLQLRIVENMQQDIFARSAFEFAYRIPKFDLVHLDRIHTPEMVNRFFDTLTIQKGLPKILIDFSLASFQIVFGLILLAIYSPYFIILGVSLIVILWLIFKITGPKGLETSLKESKYKYNLVHWLEEIARVKRSFKINPQGDLHLKKTDDIAAGYLVSREKHFQVILKQFQLFIAFKVLVAAGLLILGGVLVFQQQMNIGQFVAAEIIIILIINSVEKVLRVMETIYDVLTALEKIGFVTDLPLDENVGTAEMENQGAFAIKGLDLEFAFPKDTRKIISDLSFKVPPGGRALIAGSSGSGKTILLQIMSGILTQNDGELYLNDIPFRNYKQDDLLQRIGVSFATNQIFSGTLKENITMGRDIPQKEISAIMQLLGLSDFVAHLPKGIQTQLDSGGRRLARSIIQKVHLARILVGKPGLLLLEDPLQFVEENEKVRIIDYLMDPDRPWTVIIVADFHYWREKSTQIINL